MTRWRKKGSSGGEKALTEERGEGLCRLEELASGDAVILVGLHVDVVEGLVEGVEPGPA